MKLIFDSGPLISLTMNNLLWLIEPLSKIFKGDFYIPESVKAEVFDEPLATKKFKFEALQIQEHLTKGNLKIILDKETKLQTLDLLALANSCFSANNKNITIVHYGEVAALAAVSNYKADALVMDERITRELVEHPYHLANIMSRKLHTQIKTNKTNIEKFKQATKGIQIIRSTELAAIAFEKGFLNRYVSKSIPKPRQAVLESILWGLKLNGCAINERGIKAIVAKELKH